MEVNDQIHLSPFAPGDKVALVRHLNDRAIYDLTLRIPYPYRAADAEKWILRATELAQREGQPLHWAVRDRERQAIGGIGFDGLRLQRTHRGELGYWLARPYWGRGIMTAVVGRLCAHAFEQMGLIRVAAQVFATNLASARVLEKNGFVEEGRLRKHIEKDGRYLDARLFGLLREEWEGRVKGKE